MSITLIYMRSSLWKALLFLMWAAIATLVAGSADAAVTIWNGPSSGGVFNDDNNWTGLAPGHADPFGDLGIFNSDSNVDGTITFNDDITHDRTFVQNTAGTISFDVGEHKWTMHSAFLVGAADAPGFPMIRHIGGEIQSLQILLGTEESGPGPSMELTGSDTHWHTTYDSGAVAIGLPSNGATMRVTDGASISAFGQILIGLAGSSNSKLIIDGIGSEMVVGNYLGVGHTGDGFGLISSGSRAEIINGATGTASGVLMGVVNDAINNTLLVSGAGSTLTLTGVGNNDGSTTGIGRQGMNNVLQIEDGGVVNGTNRFVLGLEASSTGNQIIVDGGSLIGTEVVINDGSVEVTDGTIELSQFFNDGDAEFQGGGITAVNGADSTFTFNSGTVRSVNANIDNGSPFTVGNGGGSSATYNMRKDNAGNRGTHSFTNGLSLTSNGRLSGDGDIVGNVSGSAGAEVQVGASPGIIDVTGNWNNTGLEINLELDNLASAQVAGEQYDLLDITGAFTHGGAVNIDLSQYVGPPSTEQLKLIGWTSQVGLSSATTVSFSGGSPLAFSFQADGLYVTALGSGLPGDHNQDGAVNAADYVAWRKFNLNGLQGYDDFVENFGESGSGGGSQNANVPEPAAGILVIGLALIGTSIFHRASR